MTPFEQRFLDDSKILNSTLNYFLYPYRKNYMNKHYIAIDKNILIRQCCQKHSKISFIISIVNVTGLK